MFGEDFERSHFNKEHILKCKICKEAIKAAFDKSGEKTNGDKSNV